MRRDRVRLQTRQLLRLFNLSDRRQILVDVVVALALLLKLGVKQRGVRDHEARPAHDEPHERDESVEPRDSFPHVELVVGHLDSGAVVAVGAPLASLAAHVSVRGQIPLSVHVHGDEQVDDDAHRDCVNEHRGELAGVPRRPRAEPQQHDPVDHGEHAAHEDHDEVKQGHARGEQQGVQHGGHEHAVPLGHEVRRGLVQLVELPLGRRGARQQPALELKDDDLARHGKRQGKRVDERDLLKLGRELAVPPRGEILVFAVEQKPE